MSVYHNLNDYMGRIIWALDKIFKLMSGDSSIICVAQFIDESSDAPFCKAGGVTNIIALM